MKNFQALENEEEEKKEENSYKVHLKNFYFMLTSKLKNLSFSLRIQKNHLIK
jgi:hypothetical protein